MGSLPGYCPFTKKKKAEWGKTWESDTNPQGKTTTVKDDSLKGNTWEEIEPIPTATIEVEDGETSNSNGQPLDDNPDCQLSSSTETDESDVEENDEKDDFVVSNTVTETSIDLHALVNNVISGFTYLCLLFHSFFLPFILV